MMLVVLLVFAIVSDFLLDLFSVRMSLSTGKVQAWLYNQFGQNLVCDIGIAIFIQFFSFRKKAFFMQLSSLVNVGSFNRRQLVMVLLGSFIGIGLSSFLLMGGTLVVAGLLCALSLVFCLLWKDQWKDLGVGLLALGLFLAALSLFDQYLSHSQLNIHNYHLGELFVLGLVTLSIVLFRTPVAYFLSLSILHLFIGFNVMWFPILFFLFGLVSLSRFYWQVPQGRRRLYFSASVAVLLQCLQLGVSLLWVSIFSETAAAFFQVGSLLEIYQSILLGFALYMVVPLVLLLPAIFLLALTPYFSRVVQNKGESQKIINYDQRDQCFSIHLSLFLLRQEFKKYITSVHTIFKLSRESDYEQESINQKFVRYQGMLVRVGDELKELCFSIGKQRSYRWQVKEIMSYYKTVNQVELLVDDLGLVAASLRVKDQDEEWERECRFWLGLQLKLFESFFHHTLGVGHDEPEKVRANIEKSYEILDRFFVKKTEPTDHKVSSQTFYRITESIGSLAL